MKSPNPVDPLIPHIHKHGQAQLARDTGISKATISRITNSVNPTTTEKLEAIAEALGVRFVVHRVKSK